MPLPWTTQNVRCCRRGDSRIARGFAQCPSYTAGADAPGRPHIVQNEPARWENGQGDILLLRRTPPCTPRSKQKKGPPEKPLCFSGEEEEGGSGSGAFAALTQTAKAEGNELLLTISWTPGTRRESMVKSPVAAADEDWGALFGSPYAAAGLSGQKAQSRAPIPPAARRAVDEQAPSLPQKKKRIAKPVHTGLAIRFPCPHLPRGRVRFRAPSPLTALTKYCKIIPNQKLGGMGWSSSAVMSRWTCAAGGRWFAFNSC